MNSDETIHYLCAELSFKPPSEIVFTNDESAPGLAALVQSGVFVYSGRADTVRCGFCHEYGAEATRCADGSYEIFCPDCRGIGNWDADRVSMYSFSEQGLVKYLNETLCAGHGKPAKNRSGIWEVGQMFTGGANRVIYYSSAPGTGCSDVLKSESALMIFGSGPVPDGKYSRRGVLLENILDVNDDILVCDDSPLDIAYSRAEDKSVRKRETGKKHREILARYGAIEEYLNMAAEAEVKRRIDSGEYDVPAGIKPPVTFTAISAYLKNQGYKGVSVPTVSSDIDACVKAAKELDAQALPGLKGQRRGLLGTGILWKCWGDVVKSRIAKRTQ